MLHNKVVIQKIELDNRVTLFQNFDMTSPWSFEPYRAHSVGDEHPDIFPFVFDRSERFHTSVAGRETQVSLRKDKDLWFADDYGVPEGMLIGVLFPQSYVPEVFKFKEKAYIPIGAPAARTAPPGHVDVHFNQASRHAAITFLIHKSTYFGFKCIAKHYSDEFPYPRSYAFTEELLGTVGKDAAQVTVSRNDLENFKEVFQESADLEELAQRMNEVIALCKAHSNNAELDSAKSALGSSLNTAIGTAGSLTTILDSYNNVGIVNTVISKLLAFFAL
jgi:hypothetical protein